MPASTRHCLVRSLGGACRPCRSSEEDGDATIADLSTPAQHAPVFGRVDTHADTHTKSDPIDAEAAARAALSGRQTGVPKTRTGPVEMVRALRVARRSAIQRAPKPSSNSRPC